MHAMTRRITATLALLAMAWAALLPFTASARMLVADGPVEHCHKLSIDSVIDRDPASPEGPSQPRKAYCPFCASAAPAAPASPLALPCFIARDLGEAAVPREVAPLVVFPRALPPSRGPPALLQR